MVSLQVVHLSLKCDLDIFLAVYDRENDRLIIHQTDTEFQVREVHNLAKRL